MDAHAHLISLGWAGPGHSLDSRPHLQHKGRRGLAYDPSQHKNAGRGLIKPLLVSQKKNTFGVGKKTHEPAAGNEWWLKGFENALSNIGKRSDSEATSGTATPDSRNASDYRGKHIGLYGFFIKGQQMEGTIREEARKPQRGTKRKSDTFDDEEHLSTSIAPSSETPISRKKSQAKDDAAVDFEQINQFLVVRDKDRKRGQRRAGADPADDFVQMGHLFEAGSRPGTKHARRSTDLGSSKKHLEANEGTAFASNNEGVSKQNRAKRKSNSPPKLSEKEQRRQERRAARATVKQSSSKKDLGLSDSVGCTHAASPQAESSASTDDVLRRAERKRRKEQKRQAKIQTGI
jgi:hypothetical protein